MHHQSKKLLFIRHLRYIFVTISQGLSAVSRNSILYVLGNSVTIQDDLGVIPAKHRVSDARAGNQKELVLA